VVRGEKLFELLKRPRDSSTIRTIICPVEGSKSTSLRIIAKFDVMEMNRQLVDCLRCIAVKPKLELAARAFSSYSRQARDTRQSVAISTKCSQSRHLCMTDLCLNHEVMPLSKREVALFEKRFRRNGVRIPDHCFIAVSQCDGKFPIHKAKGQ